MKLLPGITFTTITACAIMLSGCGASLFSDRKDNPAIQDLAVTPHFWPWSKNGVNTFSTTASRRMVLVNSNDWGDKITTCAEPPPDVGETFVSAMSDALKVAATEPKTGINGSLANDYAKTVATQITPLLYRTQTLQIYRDAVHSHCIDRMNNWVSDKTMLNDRKINITVTPEAARTVKDQDGKGVVIPVNTVKMTVDVNDYNQMKVFYFMNALEALKVEVPLALKAQEEFFKNTKNNSLTADQILQIANATKSNGASTVVSTPTGTNIVTNSAGSVFVAAKCDEGEPKYCKEKGTEPTGTPPKCADESKPEYCASGLLPK